MRLMGFRFHSFQFRDKVSRIGESIRRSPHWWALGGAAVLLVLVVQCTYPTDKALPWSRLNGDGVGQQNSKAIARKLTADYATVPLVLDIAGKRYNTTASEAGVLADNERIVQNLTTYRWWQRIIPLSLPVLGLTRNQSIVTKLDRTRFSEYAKARSHDCAISPKNAGVVVVADTAKLDAAKNGQVCPVNLIENTFRRVSLQKKSMTVTLKPEVVKPDRSDKDVASVLEEAQQVISRKITLTLADKTTTVPKSAIASWLTFPQDDKTKTISVSIDENKVKTYLGTVQPLIYVAPGTTYIHTLDSVETGRTIGTTGRGVDMAVTASALGKQTLQGDGTVKGTLAALPPTVAYDRAYSATANGLQALLNDIVHDKGDYAISVRTASGATVSTNGSKHYHPASTYKMYVGWAIIARIAAGQMKWEDTATGGKNVSQCFDVMIVNSDNACGEWLGGQVGWSNLNNMLKAQGLSCTNLASAWYSCASDETLFLSKLHSGQLLPADQADRLLSVMKRQVYRSGIPAGVGVAVADKVGFLNGMLHDAAIVYAPHGTYQMTIMTSGSSWSQIADAARKIQAQLNRM